MSTIWIVLKSQTRAMSTKYLECAFFTNQSRVQCVLFGLLVLFSNEEYQSNAWQISSSNIRSVQYRCCIAQLQPSCALLFKQRTRKASIKDQLQGVRCSHHCGSRPPTVFQHTCVSFMSQERSCNGLQFVNKQVACLQYHFPHFSKGVPFKTCANKVLIVQAFLKYHFIETELEAETFLLAMIPRWKRYVVLPINHHQLNLCDLKKLLNTVASKVTETNFWR